MCRLSLSQHETEECSCTAIWPCALMPTFDSTYHALTWTVPHATAMYVQIVTSLGGKALALAVPAPAGKLLIRDTDGGKRWLSATIYVVAAARGTSHMAVQKSPAVMQRIKHTRMDDEYRLGVPEGTLIYDTVIQLRDQGYTLLETCVYDVRIGHLELTFAKP